MKQRLVSAKGDSTLRTRVFDLVRELDWPAPYTGRALANDFSTRWHGHEDALRAALPAELARYAAARDAGDLDTLVLFAGECVDLITDCPPAGEVLARIAEDARQRLAAT